MQKLPPEDILIKINIHNRYDKEVYLDFLPTLWFRNTWSWEGKKSRPILYKLKETSSIIAKNQLLGTYYLYYEFSHYSRVSLL